jgi:hypothetical protein
MRIDPRTGKLLLSAAEMETMPLRMALDDAHAPKAVVCHLIDHAREELAKMIAEAS